MASSELYITLSITQNASGVCRHDGGTVLKGLIPTEVAAPE